MVQSNKRIWFVLSLSSLMLQFGHAYAQQPSQAAPQNPYLTGSEGYDKGPRELTSYQPIAIDQPFAARMAEDVAAKPGVERGSVATFGVGSRVILERAQFTSQAAT
jgi:hypothetical protein